MKASELPIHIAPAAHHALLMVVRDIDQQLPCYPPDSTEYARVIHILRKLRMGVLSRVTLNPHEVDDEV